MAIIHNKSGSLSSILAKVNDNEINSLRDIIDFKNNLEIEKNNILSKHKEEVEREIVELRKKIENLKIKLNKQRKQKEEEVKNNIYNLENNIKLLKNKDGNFFKFIKLKYFSLKLDSLKNNFNKKINNYLKKINNKIENSKSELIHKEENINEIIKERGAREVNRLEMIDSILTENKDLIYGTVGELKVISRLKKLPNTFHIINDYQKEFYPPIYNRKDDDRIYSIQIDHIVIGPTGLFIIETKNWSKKSIKNVKLFSPVKQIKRAGFALFVYLNQAIKDGDMNSFTSNWGKSKISVKQFIISLNLPSNVEYQYVKVLQPDDLVKNITHNEDKFSQVQIKDLVDFLLS